MFCVRNVLLVLLFEEVNFLLLGSDNKIVLALLVILRIMNAGASDAFRSLGSFVQLLYLKLSGFLFF